MPRVTKKSPGALLNINLSCVKCIHNVEISSFHPGSKYAIVFMTRSNKTYIWITGSTNRFEEGKYYQITAKLLNRERNILSYVNMKKEYSYEEALKLKDPDGESEQIEDKPIVDVFDLIFNPKD